ncbi:hypothetical protein D3C80_966410 [compost metagenome]
MITKATACLTSIRIELNQASIHCRHDDTATTFSRLSSYRWVDYRIPVCYGSLSLVYIVVAKSTTPLPRTVRRGFLNHRVVLPLFSTSDRIKCKDLVEWRAQVNRVINLERCALILGAVDCHVAGTESPRHLQIFDVRFVDLVELSETLTMGIAAIRCPIITV